MRDKIGNDLHIEDLVEVTVAAPGNVIGRISRIQPGGTLITGKPGQGPGMTPGVIEVTIIMPVVFDPSEPRVPGMLKCVDPSPPEKKDAGKAN